MLHLALSDSLRRRGGRARNPLKKQVRPAVRRVPPSLSIAPEAGFRTRLREQGYGRSRRRLHRDEFRRLMQLYAQKSVDRAVT